MAIGKAWSRIAASFVGSAEGRHCHWCEYIKHEDGESVCTNPASKYCDGDRIRTWDGNECAETCGVFKLSAWYEDDENIRKYFAPEAAESWLKEPQ